MTGRGDHNSGRDETSLGATECGPLLRRSAVHLRISISRDPPAALCRVQRWPMRQFSPTIRHCVPARCSPRTRASPSQLLQQCSRFPGRNGVASWSCRERYREKASPSANMKHVKTRMALGRTHTSPRPLMLQNLLLNKLNAATVYTTSQLNAPYALLCPAPDRRMH